MRQLTLFVSGLFNILTLIALLTACTMQLAPEYQQSLVDGINSANLQAETLFASIAPGSSAAQYPSYKAKYDDVIGAFGALQLSAQARPVPPLAAKFLGSNTLREFCAGEDAQSCVNSTPEKLQNIVDVLNEVRRVHSTTGITAGRVDLDKGNYEQSMLDVLTIENALKR